MCEVQVANGNFALVIENCEVTNRESLRMFICFSGGHLRIPIEYTSIFGSITFNIFFWVCLLCPLTRNMGFISLNNSSLLLSIIFTIILKP